MKDILNRELKDNDLVLGMIISIGMRHGIVSGKTVYWDNGIRSMCSNLYLIEHPNAEELKIKNKIINEIKEAKKKEIKPLKIFEVGHIYESLNELKFAYLGKGKVTDIFGKTKEGYIYYLIRKYKGLKKIESHCFKGDDCFRTDHISCLKSKKRLYKDTGKVIEIKDKNIILTGNLFTRNAFMIKRDKRKMEIELYD